MKNFFLVFPATALLFIVACNQSPVSSNTKLVCSTQSDLFYLGYKGKIKQVTEILGDKADEDPETLGRYLVRTKRFDEAGYITLNEEKVVTNNEPSVLSSTVYKGINPRVGTSDYYIDSTIWVGNVQTIVSYAVQDGIVLYRLTRSRYEYDDKCMLSLSETTSYDKTGSILSRDSFNANTLTKDRIEARVKYGHASIFHSDKIKIEETDKQGNPTKIIYLSPEPARGSIKYEYYQ